MTAQYNTIFKLLSVILLCSIFGGCTSIGSTKPNDPYPGPYPTGFNEFAVKSPLLAQELAKLPELQDGISENEATALEYIMKLYSANPDMFDNAFEQMYKEGNPEVRKYCSPLQATYWLALDGKYEELVDTISYYDPEVLIQKAWVLDETKHPKLSIPQALTSASDSEINNERWRNFSEVTDRLNSPYLINFYQQQSFIYISRSVSKRGPKSPSQQFKDKEGACSGFAAFSEYCLSKAGYKARAIRVKSPSGALPGLSFDASNWGHVVCEFEEDGEKYIMDNSCRRCTNYKGIMKSVEYLKIYPQTGVGLETK
jgi:hypothetical protein